METIDDGGPAFSFPGGGPGLSQRALFAAILMHSEAVTCGVPGEACDALVAASQAAGTDVIEHMAINAVQGADALLRALAHPPEPKYRELDHYDQARLSEAENLASLVADLLNVPDLPIPDDLRRRLRGGAAEVISPVPF